MSPAEKLAAEKHAAAARVALEVTERDITALLAGGAHVDRAAPFIAAATTGLAGRNVAHIPENFAAEAVRLGLAVDALMDRLSKGKRLLRSRPVDPSAFTDDDELERATRPGA